MPFVRIERREDVAAPAGELSPEERRFARGTRTIADLVAPAAFEVARDHVRADHHYARALVVTGYPRTVGPGWLSPLIDFEEPLEIALHVHPLESGPMVRTLTHKMVQLHSSRLLADRDGKLADPEREVAYEDAERLRDALQRGDERVFSVGLYVLVRAPSRPALDDLTRRVEVTLDGLLAHSRVAVFEQDGGFRSCLPQGLDELLVHRNLDTSSLATCFPFASSSLSMETGVLYGVAAHNHAPVIFDPFDASLENANSVVFAKSGAGKSYFTKVTALRLMLLGVNFLVVDPEGEYRALTDAVGGQNVRLAVASPHRINPFDLPPPDPSDADGRDPLAERVASLLGLLGIMLAEPGRPLGPRERALLDRVLYQTYARRGIDRDVITHERPPPILYDLVTQLEAEDGDLNRDLVLRLGPYTSGSMAGLFAGPTNVELDRSFVNCDVQGLDPQLRPIAVHQVASFVWNVARRERRPRILDVDECWTLMQHADGGAHLASMARRFRKQYMGLACVTQDVNDFLASDHGRTVLANSAVKLLMKQDPSTIERVVETFRLSAEERQFLLGAGKGEGLLFARGSHVAIRVEASPAEHRLATTAPRELAELAEAGGAR
jgi:conjugal transfer ATP-binding protein TraC